MAKFSGGRSSALATRMALREGEVDLVCFTNTGLESKATYEFLEAVDEQWLDGRLVILEYKGGKPIHKVVPSVADCDRTGAPMTTSVKELMLPSPMHRSCTRSLKIETTFSYIYQLIDYKTTKVSSIMGFRADEPRRLARMKSRNEAIHLREQEGKNYLIRTDEQYAPLAEAGWDRQKVLDEFKRTPLQGLSFDPSDPNVRLSNCEGCFFSNLEEKLRVVQHRPDIADYWDWLERDNFDRKGQDISNPDKGRLRQIAKLDEEPQDDFERRGFAMNPVPWSVLKRVAAKRGVIPIQSDIFYAGGCGDGHCNTDIAEES